MSSYKAFNFREITHLFSDSMSFSNLNLPLNSSPIVTLLITMAFMPVLVIALHILRQLYAAKNPSLPPVVFHWIPVLGSVLSYGQDPIIFFFRCREKYGNVFTFILLGRRMTVALGPKGNHFVLGASLNHVSAGEAYSPLTTPVFGKDVVYDVPDHVFMEQKRFAKVGLSSDAFRAYVGMIENEIESFINSDPDFTVYRQQKEEADTKSHSDSKSSSKQASKWGVFKARHKMAELIILTASRTLQGQDVRESLDKSFAQRYEDLDRGFTPLNFLFPNLPLPSYKRRDKAQLEMSDFFINVIRKRKYDDNKCEHDMLAALETQTYRDGSHMREHEIANLMIAMLMAGQHTSSATGAWALLHISERPDVADALYLEQKEYFSTSTGELRSMTYDEMKDLPLLNAVIHETLRLHPPIHSMIRKVVSDLPVPTDYAMSADGVHPYVIPKGHYLLAAPAQSQVDPQYWHDPLKWIPQRWIERDDVAAFTESDVGITGMSKGTASVHLPFGAGRHRCIGEQFSFVQLGVIIATFVRKMEMRIQKRVPDHDYNTMITLPKEPTGIMYRRRSASQ